MNVTREVILDLLPLYLAGEASPATRLLVEDYLNQDPDLARRIRLQWEEGLNRAAPSNLPPELELKSLRRTRRLMALQTWAFGLGLGFAAIGLSAELSTSGGHIREFHFLMRDNPVVFGGFLVASLVCWSMYLWLRHRLRTAGF